MAIDSSLFAIDIPAGTYAAGDKVQLNIKAGPAIVRSGRGAALLKRLTVGTIGDASGSASFWKVSVQNSDWVDPMMSATCSLRESTALDERAGSVQRGNDCPLTPNSSWMVTAECISAVTTTIDNTIFALIDVDYPSVAAIVDPDALPGIPCSIQYDTPAAINGNALGTIANSSWDVFNTDIFKAGFEYAIQKTELYGGVYASGFIALENAAGMGGLCRIMPIFAGTQSIRNKIEYATKLVKGPMDIKFLLFNNAATATTGTMSLLMDFVKRRV